MAVIPGSVRVGGFIAPSDSTDTYATQSEEWGRGGWRTVADITARNAITADRRKIGMLVRVLDGGTGTEKFYTLVGGIADGNWTEQNFGGSLPSNVATFATTDFDFYVRTDGNDANDGLADNSAHAFRTPQAAIRALPKVPSEKYVNIRLGPGDFPGIVVGGGFGSSGNLPEFLWGYLPIPEWGSLHNIRVIGTKAIPTLSQGDVSGLMVNVGKDSDKRTYFDKNPGSADWVEAEVVGKIIEKYSYAGWGHYGYVVACSGSRLTLGRINELYDTPTTQWRMREYATRITSSCEEALAWASWAVVFFGCGYGTRSVNFFNLKFHALDSQPGYKFNFLTGGKATFTQVEFSAQTLGNFGQCLSIQPPTSFLLLQDVFFRKIGTVGSSSWPIFGLGSGLTVKLDGFTAIDNVVDINGWTWLYYANTQSNYNIYLEGNSGGGYGFRIDSSNIWYFQNCTIKNFNTGIVATELAGRLALLDAKISGCTYGIDFATYGLTSANLVVGGTVEISRCGADGIKLRNGLIDTTLGSSLIGTGNVGVGVNLPSNAELLIRNVCTITGTGGDVKIGDQAVPYTDLASSGDFAVNQSTGSSVRKV